QHYAGRGQHAQGLDRKRLMLVILEAAQHGAGLFLEVFELTGGTQTESGSLRHAAQPRSGDLAELAFEDRESDLDVQVGAEAIELFGARGLITGLGRRVVGGHGCGKLRDRLQKSLDVATARGARAIG